MPFQPFASDWDRAAWSDIDQWRCLAVEIAEIRRCAEVGDQAHDRLALLLVDHLVEVIVGREVNTRLALQPADSVIEELRHFRDGGRDLSPELNNLIDEHVGPEQRRRLDAHLHEKTKYLVKHDVLKFEEREVLCRMHEYRNAAYHRDTLEADLISDLALAYMILAGQLLARHQPLMYTVGTSVPGDVVTPAELSGLLTDGLEMDLTKVASRFSNHALKRVDAITRAVGMARLIQHVGTDAAPEQTDSTPLDDAFSELLKTLDKITPKQLQSWTKRATDLRKNIKSLVNLMIRYIGLDQALSEIEPSATRLEVIVDKSKQDYLDEIRGK